MSDQQDSGDRTEEPTAKKLREARGRGEVDRGRDVGPTASLLVATALVALYAGDAGARLAALLQAAIDAIGQPFAQAATELAWRSAGTMLEISLTVAVPIAVVAVLAEFLNVGPVFSARPLTPDASRLDVVAGLKRMVSADSWVELAKSLVKTLTLLVIAALVVRELLPRLSALYRGSPQALGEALRAGTAELLGWTVAIFCAVAVIDRLYQRHAFLKRMRMSVRDIQRELREDMGDPALRGQRQQLQREWAQRSEVAATRSAHMLVVNPTHVAIALDWDAESVPVPVVAAKGEGPTAALMRAAAESEAVPVLRDVPLARALLERGEVGESVPDDLFDAVAQAIVWAESIRKGEQEPSTGEDAAGADAPAPGRQG